MTKTTLSGQGTSAAPFAATSNPTGNMTKAANSTAGNMTKAANSTAGNMTKAANSTAGNLTKASRWGCIESR